MLLENKFGRLKNNYYLCSEPIKTKTMAKKIKKVDADKFLSSPTIYGIYLVVSN